MAIIKLFATCLLPLPFEAAHAELSSGPCGRKAQCSKYRQAPVLQRFGVPPWRHEPPVTSADKCFLGGEWSTDSLAGLILWEIKGGLRAWHSGSSTTQVHRVARWSCSISSTAWLGTAGLCLAALGHLHHLAPSLFSLKMKVLWFTAL